MRWLFLILVSIIPSPRFKAAVYRFMGAQIGRNFSIGLFSYIKCGDYSQVRIGHNVEIGHGTAIHANQLVVGNHCSFGSGVVVNGDGLLSMGNNCYIAVKTYIDCSGGVILGNQVGTPPMGGIFSHNYSQTWFQKGNRYKKIPVRIGNQNWFGPGTIIAGVNIGNGCLVSAQSLVIQDLPDNAFAMGNPARVLKRNDITDLPQEFIQTTDFQSEIRSRIAGQANVLFLPTVSKNELEMLAQQSRTIVFTMAVDSNQVPAHVHIYNLSTQKIMNPEFDLEPGITRQLRGWGIFMEFDEFQVQ